MGLSDFSDSQAVAEPDDEKLDLTITQTCLSESVRSETLQPKKQNKTKQKTKQMYRNISLRANCIHREILTLCQKYKN